MSTLRLGAGQGFWGSNLRFRLLYWAFLPVHMALRVEEAVYAVLGGAVGRARVSRVAEAAETDCCGCRGCDMHSTGPGGQDE